MQPDILHYRRFYDSPLGQTSADLINQLIGKWFNRTDGVSVAGMGYALPYLDPLLAEGANAFALMPPRQGVVHWPHQSENRAVLVEPYCLPFADSSLDKLIFAHALEHVGWPEHLLREAWRVLAPGGELIVIVPNRRRIWSALDVTPFGAGRPFSQQQIYKMLTDQLLQPLDWNSCLMVPPINSRMGAKLLRWAEKPGHFLGRGLGGVLCVRAVKQIYGAIPAKRRKMRQIPALVGRASSAVLQGGQSSAQEKP